MKKLYLHIGAAKIGTSILQSIKTSSKFTDSR